MISANGIVGLALLVGALRHHLATFNPEGTGSALATVITLASVTLVLPRFTTAHPGPEFSASQLAFAAVASLALYALFVFTQTVRHRDFFLPVEPSDDLDGDGHADPPSSRAALAALGFPAASVGVVIALLVLLPESIAAVRGRPGRRPDDVNLAYGSAMASIGLTIPRSPGDVWLDDPLELGLEPMQIVLLAVTAVVSVLTVVPGRAKPLNGGVHLVLLAAFLFVSVKP